MPRRGRAVTHPAVVPLPATRDELLAQRRTRQRLKLSDYVKRLLEKPGLFEEPEFQRYSQAVWNEDAVTGSVEWDRCMSARIVQDWAVQDGGMPELAVAKLRDVGTALEIALRAFGASRTQRRTAASEAV